MHAYDPHTYVLRQSKSVHYEGPFMYLLLGNEAALLLDTGATAEPARFPLRATVDAILASWLADHPRSRYRLIVAHSHGHHDHIAADAQFADRPDTTVVGVDAASVRAFFGLSRWPYGTAAVDLGGRILEVTGCPGHQEASIAVYDPWSGFLLTGDTVYPGRLYIRESAAYVASLEHLVAFASARPVTRVMGCHIEMTRTPGRDYPIGSAFQPDEAPLPMPVTSLAAVRDAAVRTASRPGVHVFDAFILYNGPCRRALLWHAVRSLAQRVATRLLHP